MATKRKPKYITLKNYQQFKPSEFVRSFISDIEVGIALSKKTKRPIDFGDFLEREYCLPCLGGLACMNFGSKFDSEDQESIEYITGYLGDAIRLGDKSEINHSLLELYPSYHHTVFEKGLDDFEGKLNASTKLDLLTLQDLKEQITYIADRIEASGQ